MCSAYRPIWLAIAQKIPEKPSADLLKPGIFRTQKEFRAAYMAPGKPRQPADPERLRGLMRDAMILRGDNQVRSQAYGRRPGCPGGQGRPAVRACREVHVPALKQQQ
jgi:hypothetical protein